MPKDFVKVNQSDSNAVMAARLIEFIGLYRRALDLGEYVKGVMEHNINGADYADLELRFGLAVGQGQIAYNLVAGTLGAMKGTAQSADGLTLIDRVG